MRGTWLLSVSVINLKWWKPEQELVVWLMKLLGIHSCEAPDRDTDDVAFWIFPFFNFSMARPLVRPSPRLCTSLTVPPLWARKLVLYLCCQLALYWLPSRLSRLIDLWSIFINLPLPDTATPVCCVWNFHYSVHTRLFICILASGDDKRMLVRFLKTDLLWSAKRQRH